MRNTVLQETLARFRIAALIIVSLVLLRATAWGQVTDIFNAQDAQRAVKKLASLLESDFIYPDIGKAYAGMLRSKIKSGDYSKFDSAGAFARIVTADLQAVQPEGHLRLQPPTAAAPGNLNKADTTHLNGVGKYGWLTPEVAYLSFYGFSGNQKELSKMLSKLKSVLDELSSAKTIIFDVRNHSGGGLEEMDVIFSYFFSEPTPLVMMDTRLDVAKRGGSPLADGTTLKTVNGPEGIIRRIHTAVPLDKKTALSKARIFLLVSKKTASAGEHLALALKRTGRAVLIGETTMGAGHFGRTMDLGGGYRAFIPVGRTFDPDTGKGWEQTGVEPNVKVSAEQAFDEALRRAGVDLDAGRKALESFKVE